VFKFDKTLRVTTYYALRLIKKSMQSRQASQWVTSLAQLALLQPSRQQAEPQPFLVQSWPVVQPKRPSKQPKLALVAGSTLARW
jgi:hypothetical protein